MCKGTTNMEDVYYVNVEHIPYNQKIKLANLKWIENHNGIPVDRCIGKEIEFLINQGVITVGSCCGHGKDEPCALVREESKEIIESLGYKLESISDYHNNIGTYKIKLKNRC
jgi:hypothetical protein